MIGWVVQQWQTTCWRGREPCNCSVQEAGSLRTRETHEAVPVQGWRPGSSLESRWYEPALKGWRSWHLMSMGDGSCNKCTHSGRVEPAHVGFLFFPFYPIHSHPQYTGWCIHNSGQVSSLETPSQTHPEVCFANSLGISQSSQADNQE
jgi:hypothetical protein